MADVVSFVAKLHGEEAGEVATQSGGTGESMSPFDEFFPTAR